MKITVEAVHAILSEGRHVVYNDVYLDDVFEGCLGLSGKLEFETVPGEHELIFKDGERVNKIRFSAEKEAYFWISARFSFSGKTYIKIRYKGNDLNIIEII